MIKRVVTFIGVILLGVSSGFAQKYDIKTYTVNDGLPSSFVYDIIVDDLGIAWFATANGLVRFDGKNFRNYEISDGLRDELIYEIYNDDDGELWVTTEFGGVARFENDSIIYISDLAILDSVLIHFISKAPNGKLWFGTDDDGIFEWEKGGEVVSALTTENGLPSNRIWDFVMDEHGLMWITTSMGIAVYKEGEGVIRSYTKESGLSGNISYQVLIAKNGDKWIATNNGVSILKSDHSIQQITELNNVKLEDVYSLAQDDGGKIWIGTERKGLFIYDGQNAKQIKKRNGLSSNYIYRLIKDVEGNIWVATDGDGVSILREEDFIMFDSSSDLEANSIFSALKASTGTLWFGTENGISNYENNNFKNIEIPAKYFNEGEIWDIEELPNGHLLMLGADYSILEYDGKNFYYPEYYDEIFDYYVSDILVDEDETLWFTAFQMLLKYKKGELTEYAPPDEKYWQTDLNAIMKDSRGYYWISTEAGVANFDGRAFRYISEQQGLKGGSIFDVKEDKKGNIWIGTNKGVYILSNFDEEGMPSSILPFEILDTYMQETIFLQFDKNGNLWQATNGGLNYYDLSNWKIGEMAKQLHFPFTNYGHGIEFNGAASILEDDGTLWFGSDSKGVVRVENRLNSESVKTKDSPKLYLREVLANNETVYNQLKRGSTSSIGVPYNRNNINFRFNGIDFKNPNRVVYKYMLKGFEQNWNYASDISEVRYTSIPSGEYDFIISAKSIKSDWGIPVSLAKLTISEPFWVQTWFFCLIGITLIIIVISIVKIMVSHAEKRDLQLLVNDQTKDIQNSLKEKEVLIKEIHHRVKNNLAVISGLLELQSWNLPDGDAKNAILESRLRVLTMATIHENLYQNKDLARINFKEFLEDLVKSISITMSKPNQSIKIDLDLDNTFLDVNVGIPVGLITNEIISNCFKHAFYKVGEGIISVQFKEKKESYFLKVKDNGKGSDKDLLNEVGRSSLGITLVKSLVSQINGKITYSSDGGSIFTIEVPFKKS